MRLTHVTVDGFLAFERMQARFGPGLNVLVGPNGSGKSTLLRAVELARLALDGAQALEASDFASAGHLGRDSFTVTVGLEVLGDGHRAALRAFLTAAWMELVDAGNIDPDGADAVLEAVSDALGDDYLHLASGELVVGFDRQASRPWTVVWQFASPGGPAHAVLDGPGGPSIAVGRWVADPGPGAIPTATLRNATTGTAADIRTGGLHVGWKALLLPRTARRLAVPTGRPWLFASRLAPLAGLRDAARPGSPNGQITLADVVAAAAREGVALTVNHRLPAQEEFAPPELASAARVSDGTGVALAAARDKNGASGDRERWRRVQRTFAELTGRGLELRVGFRPDDGRTTLRLWVEETAPGGGGGFEVPLALAGAGLQEAAAVSTLLHTPAPVLLLDEPGVHLSQLGQRSLLRSLRLAGAAKQVVVVTHQPEMVPVAGEDDLRNCLRITRRNGVGSVGVLREAGRVAAKQLALLGPLDRRALLFCDGAVLCEGVTELAALEEWLDVLPDGPSAGNILLLDVNGDSGFPGLIRLCEAFEVPWAVVADGPALRSDSKLAGWLREQDRSVPDGDDLRVTREGWRALGVHTLASRSDYRAGEIENVLARLDQDLLRQCVTDMGGSKPRVGRAFAQRHPVPADVLDLWARLKERLRGQSAPPAARPAARQT